MERLASGDSQNSPFSRVALLNGALLATNDLPGGDWIGGRVLLRDLTPRCSVDVE